MVMVMVRVRVGFRVRVRVRVRYPPMQSRSTKHVPLQLCSYAVRCENKDAYIHILFHICMYYECMYVCMHKSSPKNIQLTCMHAYIHTCHHPRIYNQHAYTYVHTLPTNILPTYTHALCT